MPWDPERYEQFKQERFAPFDDLARMVRVRNGLRVIDLGCGTGELTARLAGMLPDSDVLGIDSSAEMLSRCEAFARPGLRFEQRDIEDIEGEWDLIFSNAALQWVQDHGTFFPKLFDRLRPAGQLVVQMPSNYMHPTHRLIDDLAQEEPFRTGLGGYRRSWSTRTIEEYAELLYDAGATDINVFEKIYPHVLPDADALADWTSGTALVPFMERMPAGMRDLFMSEYRAHLRAQFPETPVFYGFKRILFSAMRPA
jgi:trans-aconitate 2-methyltransferase